MNRLLCTFCFFLLLVVSAQPVTAQRFRVMTYNVENLFDTCHDAGFDDYEFLPDGKRRWNSGRYWGKQDRLCRVIAMAGGEAPVDLVGLCEVENDSVLRDLTERTRLRRLGYKYEVTHSLDVRGLDVALLYQPRRFRVLSSNGLTVPPDKAYGRPTRDILHVSGLLQSGDTLDVFVCHLPSRRGGAKAVEDFRSSAAQFLRQKADSVLRQRQRPALVLMGDFNDAATDRSLDKGFGVRLLPPGGEAAHPSEFYALSADLRTECGVCGTYKYRGEWNRLDQMIVSGALLTPSAPYFVHRGTSRNFAPYALLQSDKTHGGHRPHPTFQGPLYVSGFSDHLPLVADFGFGE